MEEPIDGVGRLNWCWCQRLSVAYLWGDVIVHVNPPIGSKFRPCFYWEGLMTCTRIWHHGVRIIYTWPKQCRSFFRHYCDSKGRKIGTTSSLNITQVNEECQNSWTTLSISLIRNIVVAIEQALPSELLGQAKFRRTDTDALVLTEYDKIARPHNVEFENLHCSPLVFPIL